MVKFDHLKPSLFIKRVILTFSLVFFPNFLGWRGWIFELGLGVCSGWGTFEGMVGGVCRGWRWFLIRGVILSGISGGFG